MVGVALFLKLFNEAEHLRNVFGRAGLERGREAPERNHVFLHGLRELSREGVGRDAALRRAADDFVVHVGDVAHEGHLVARRLKPAANDVESDERAAVADVAVVVNGDAADVHAHAAGFDRFEGALFARIGRINRKHGIPEKSVLLKRFGITLVAAHAQVAARTVLADPAKVPQGREKRFPIQSSELLNHGRRLQLRAEAPPAERPQGLCSIFGFARPGGRADERS